MRSRIAVFEGYGTPFAGRPSSTGRPFARPPGLGRRAYYVPPQRYVSSDDRGGYGPARKPRRGYHVKAKRNTPAMRRAMNKFKKCARKCAKRRGGKFPTCMRRCIRSKRPTRR